MAEHDHAIRLRGSTVGALTTVLGTLAAADASAFLVEIRIIGRTAAGLTFGALRIASFERTAAALRLVGIAAVVPAGVDAGLIAAVIDAVVSGQSINIQVTGVAAQTVQWFGIARILILTP